MNRSNKLRRMGDKLAACLATTAIFLTSVPQAAVLAASNDAVKAANSLKETVTTPKIPLVPRAQKNLQVRKIPLVLSAAAKDEELMTKRVFDEPLVPMSIKAVQGENQALSQAITSFVSKNDLENVSDLTKFLSSYPKSRWHAALEFDLGMLRYQTGYISDAMTLWQAAWNESKAEKGRAQMGIANRAYAELAVAKSRIGRKAEVQKLIAEAGERPLWGSVAERIKNAKYGLWAMDHMTGNAFKCGPYAVNSILSIGQKRKTVNDVIKQAKSTANGTNLAQVKELAAKVGLDYQVAKRSKGAPIIVPSVMHWSVGHFAAILSKDKDKYFVNDPTFDQAGNRLLSVKAIDAESDGYFLVPSGGLPAGWIAVTDTEAAKVWGKGEAFGWNFNALNPCVNIMCSDCVTRCLGGMATANAFKSQGTLNIQDMPLSYSPPIGTDMGFICNYNYLETNQPATFSFTNLTQNWNINWLSYCTVDASNNVTVRTRGGGSEYYPYTPPPDNFTSPYTPNLYSQAQMAQAGGGFQRMLPDGSMEVFGLQSTGSPTLYFMTQLIDPRGNVTTINYTTATGTRISSIVDAIGQTTNFAYVSTVTTNPGYYLVASITDPFGRSCSFTYDSANTQLLTITDSIGLKSQFSYLSSGSFIYMMSTPYGVTSFYSYGTAAQNGLITTYPDGTCSQIQSNIGIGKTSYWWNREASMLYPSDSQNAVPRHAEATLWELEAAGNGSTGVLSAVPWTVQKPLQDLITYSYDGLSNGENTGSINKPTQICQGPISPGDPDHPSPNNQYYNYQYNPLGKVTKYIDPVGRTFSFKYAANNIDLLEARQTRSTNNDLLGKWEYNNTQHLPNVYIDGSGQTTQYTYNTFGELTSVTDANSNTTTFNYQTSAPFAYLLTIVGPTGFSNDITTFTYDTVGRVRTVQDSLGYTLTFAYDNMDRLVSTTFPDSTTEVTTYNLLDPVIFQDRLGRITQDTYDNMRQRVKSVDSLGRTTQYSWCSCGSLSHMIDGNGNETTWNHDELGRPIQKVYADGSTTQYAYEQVPVPATSQITLGRLLSVTDALGQVKTFSYNMDNTVSALTYTNVVNPTPNPNRSFTYDANYMRLSQATNSWGTLQYSYNPYITDPFGTTTTGGGRISKISNGGVISNSDITVGYDVLGRLTNRSVNGSANSDSFGYDAISRLTSDNSNLLGNFAFSYGPNASYGTHELDSITYPIGTPTAQKTTFTWGTTSTSPNFEQLTQITNVAGGSSPPNLSQYSQTYNTAIDITQWTQAVTTGGTTTTNTINLGYDRCDQLLTASGTTTYTYAYDNAANRTSSQVGATTTTATPNTLNQITSLSGGTTGTLTYDANGNLLSDTSTGNQFQWDAENRLQKITYTGGATSQFTYDPLGGLVKIVESTGSTKQFVRTASEILEERDASSAVQAQFFDYGQTRGGANFYYTKDHLGSIRDVTNASSVTQRQYSYDPYGVVSSTGSGTEADFKYAGYYYHAPSGLNLTLNRAYNSRLGRFINRDPISENGGVNVYTYVGNSPISSTDPTGLWQLYIEWGSATSAGERLGGLGYVPTPIGAHGNLILKPDPGEKISPFIWKGNNGGSGDLFFGSGTFGGSKGPYDPNKKGSGIVTPITSGTEGCDPTSAINAAFAKTNSSSNPGLKGYRAIPIPGFGPANNSNTFLYNLVKSAGFTPPSGPKYVWTPGYGPWAPGNLFYRAPMGLNSPAYSH